MVLMQRTAPDRQQIAQILPVEEERLSGIRIREDAHHFHVQVVRVNVALQDDSVAESELEIVREILRDDAAGPIG